MSRLFIVRAVQASLADGSLAGYPSVLMGNRESLEKLSKIEVLQNSVQANSGGSGLLQSGE